MVAKDEINQPTAKNILVEMFESGAEADSIVAARGLRQISDSGLIASLVQKVLTDNPDQVASYLDGKETLSRWFFGQVMRLAGGKASPAIVQKELDAQLNSLKH